MSKAQHDRSDMETIEDPAFLRSVLDTTDVPCPACGYNLRGLTTPVCPECNLRLVLRIGLAEPRIGAFVTGLVGISAGLGFCGIMLTYLVITIIFSSQGNTSKPSLLAYLIIGTCVGAAMLVGWIVRRRRMVQARRLGRIIRVVVALVLGLAPPVIILCVIR